MNFNEKNYQEFWFVDYNNGYEKTYFPIYIDIKYKDKDFTEFVNKIPTTRFTGCTLIHFQQALQDNNIKFIVKGYALNEEEKEKWMKVEFNRNNIKIIKHHNIGNY